MFLGCYLQRTAICSLVLGPAGQMGFGSELVQNSALTFATKRCFSWKRRNGHILKCFVPLTEDANLVQNMLHSEKDMLHIHANA